jgi:hypothetical protein
MQPSLDDTPITENQQPVPTAEGGIRWPQVEGISPDLIGPLKADHPCAALHTVINGVLVHTKPKRKKVCIVGYAENSRHLAWFNDPDCEIWGVNQLYRFIPRADRWFQVHRDWHDSRKWATGADLGSWLRAAPCPVYMIDAQPDMPMTLPYPKAWVKEQLQIHEYFTSSIAMMLALAIAEGFEEIGIYGIDLIVGREYHYEKACVEFYLGLAHARGVKYHLPQQTALLWQAYTYGYDAEPDYGFFSLDKLRRRSLDLHKQVASQRDQVHVLQGHVEEAELVRDKMPKESGSRATMEARIVDLRKELDAALNMLYLHDGAQQEASRMYQILELKSRGGSVEG